jgi:hypothetical protein
MSYELCKSIVKKNDKIILSVASSNVEPKHYSKWEYNVVDDLEKNEFYLFTDIINGNIHLNSSVYEYRYALFKTREYMQKNNIDSYDDLYERKSDYYREKIKELIGIDLTSDYWKDEELKNRYNTFEKENTDLIDNLRYESYYKVYGKVYEVFKGFLNEKFDNTLYTLYSNDYHSFIKCGRKGSFYYGYSSAKEKGKYKEMYCKMKEIDRCGVVMQRVVLTDKEIQKELDNLILKEQAKKKIKDLKQVEEDLEKFKNGLLDIDKYYLKELCKLYDIKEMGTEKNITIPKKLNYIMNNGYNFSGNCSWKTSSKISYIRKQLLEKVGA